MENLSEITKELLLSTPENIHSVSYGYIIKNNEMTSELGLIFSVIKKLPLEEIADGELIPKNITISGETFKTDVIESEPLSLFQTCQQVYPEYYTWQSIDPPNQSKIRPLKGGISIRNYPTVPGIGTLGFIAIDNDTYSLVGVTNNHVIIKDAFYVSERNPSGIQENAHFYQNGASIQRIVQPGDGSNLSNAIGIVKKYVPIKKMPVANYLDAACLTINQSDIDFNSSYLQLGLSSITTPMEFATTSELNGLLINQNPVFSSGRTTGAKGEGRMKLRVTRMNSTSYVSSYDSQLSGFTVYFSDLITVQAFTSTTATNACDYPSSAGDSGSAVIADFNGTKKIIGLLFAGSQTITSACRIDRLSQELNLSPWLGQTNVNFSNTGSTEQICINLPSTKDVTDGVSGKRYWQIGFC